jgi:hypothetical protein
VNGQQHFHCDIPKAPREILLRKKASIELCIGTGAKGTRIRVLLKNDYFADFGTPPNTVTP